MDCPCTLSWAWCACGSWGSPSWKSGLAYRNVWALRDIFRVLYLWGCSSEPFCVADLAGKVKIIELFHLLTEKGSLSPLFDISEINYRFRRYLIFLRECLLR